MSTKNSANPLDVEFTDIKLEEEKRKKKPRRILHFSDGILEEYSTDEEEEVPAQPVVDPKTLTWLPWIWYNVVVISRKTLSVADICGENLAWFFGITTPKYQYAIDEYYRMKEEEEKERELEEKRKKRMEEEKLSHVEIQSFPEADKTDSEQTDGPHPQEKF